MLFGLTDPRARHLRKLRRRLRSARTWTVWASTFGGAALVAVPYAGLGWPDIFWAGTAGGSLAVALFRWSDYRSVKALPVPEPVPQRPASERITKALAPVVGPNIVNLFDRPRRISVKPISAAAPAAYRLNSVARRLPELLGRLGPHAGDTAREAAGAHEALREVAIRVNVIEKTLPVVPPESRASLLAARADLVSQLDDGAVAYEQLASAAAECVAALARGGDKLAVTRLTEAGDKIAGLAKGLVEVKDQNTAYGLSG